MTGNGRMDKHAVLMECDGLSTRNFTVPPFRVEASQNVCLHVPLSMAIWHETLMPILVARIAHPSLHLHGSVSYLDRPMPQWRWWRGWHSPSAGHWLTAESGLTSTEAAAVLSTVDLPADMSVGRIGWRERTLIALEACLLRPPDLLVFDTCGNGPETISYVFDRLASRTPQFALLYLKTRLEKEDACLPGAVCHEVVRTGALATIAE
jgi:hypothetical protein